MVHCHGYEFKYARTESDEPVGMPGGEKEGHVSKKA